MTAAESGRLLAGALNLTMLMLLLGIFLAFIRMVKGPTAADRVVALDLSSILVTAFLTALSIHQNEGAFLDVAIAYALVSFLGTVALARFIEHRNRIHAGQGEN
jgi:multicomponent Na+:H+ antiporter subunit F